MSLVSWVGLRGAVPIILATFPLVVDIPEATITFDVVFFAVLASVLIQGTTIPVVARWLGVATPPSEGLAHPRLEFIDAEDSSTDLHEMTVRSGSQAEGRQLIDLRLPGGTLVVLVTSDADYVVPQGSTVLEAGDLLLVLADEAVLDPVRELIEDGP
ncbi:hypothetical protein BH23ACT2_BH23ACT2_04070 [soil metagenome]